MPESVLNCANRLRMSAGGSLLSHGIHRLTVSAWSRASLRPSPRSSVQESDHYKAGNTLIYAVPQIGPVTERAHSGAGLDAQAGKLRLRRRDRVATLSVD